jgi:hypothetical protein
MSKFISVIIPLPEMEYYIQDYRFKYDFFAKKGIPVHITLLYEISPNKYYNKRKMLINIFEKILQILNKKELIINKIIVKKNLFGLGLKNDDELLLNKLQHNLINFLDIQNKRYYNNNFKPHITIFTGNDNIGWKNKDIIEKKMNNKLPIKINIDKIWVLEIDKVKNIASIVDIIIL